MRPRQLPLHLHSFSGKSCFGFPTLLKATMHLGCSPWLQTSQDAQKAQGSTEKMQNPGVWKLHSCILRKSVWAHQLQCSIVLMHCTACTQSIGEDKPRTFCMIPRCCTSAHALWWNQTEKLNGSNLSAFCLFCTSRPQLELLRIGAEFAVSLVHGSKSFCWGGLWRKTFPQCPV